MKYGLLLKLIRPPYTRDLAKITIDIINSAKDEDYNQHYNFSNSGSTSWADFAREIFLQTGISCNVNGISTQDYGAIAPRPHWSVMSKDKIKDSFGINIKDWKVSLSDCLDRIQL